MIEVVSIKFKNRGKCYFFSPNGLQIQSGDKVIVETSKGLEIADCCRGNHNAQDDAVIQPLRPVIRVATAEDMRVAQINKQREKEAFEICQKKIEEHKLDMKLVDVECNFEGNKTMFFFTSDGRVDFRELVKDLAGIFRNRIELRQIGVRDEAKMVGGMGICGRPYCCSQFLDDFQPVSTKMAKVQSLSLNPTKISGSCGRLMCCLRYEQDAYEDLIRKVPKQGAFVQTKDGYGTAMQVNLLRQTVKVRLDNDTDDTLHVYKSNELASVPNGRPKEGEPLPNIFTYVPEEAEPEEPETPVQSWVIPEPTAVVVPKPEEPTDESAPQTEEKPQPNRRRRPGRGKPMPKAENADAPKAAVTPKRENRTDNRDPNRTRQRRPKAEGNTAVVKPVKVEAKPLQPTANAAVGDTPKPKNNNRRRSFYRGKPKAKPGADGQVKGNS